MKEKYSYMLAHVINMLTTVDINYSIFLDKFSRIINM